MECWLLSHPIATMRPFEPIVRNPHLLTILGNFWPRGYDFAPFPENRRLVRTDPDTQVLVVAQRPVKAAIGHVVLLHGLEGSGDSGYNRSMAWQALTAGFIVHRLHMRTCGGTGHLCKTLYHGGLTSDLRAFLTQLKAERDGLPVFLIGFSLGGNVALKFAGEEGETDLIEGVCAISTPIDLAACARRLGERDNSLYEKRFVSRMKERLIATGRYSKADLAGCHTLWEIDDRVTAPSFGFEGAAHYYGTQSAQNFFAGIRVPTLLIQAKDDSFIPFGIFSHPAIAANPHITLLATEYGGHLGFISKRAPRFWVDQAALEFICSHLPTPVGVGRSNQCGD
jgi:predicted alpha/beta-fold hydrolase